MRESIKAASIVLATVTLLFSAVVTPSLAAIFEEGWDESYGQYQDWARAYLGAWLNIRTMTWYGISHDHDWSWWGPYYYAGYGINSNDRYAPFTLTWVEVYYTGEWHVDAVALVQF